MSGDRPSDDDLLPERMLTWAEFKFEVERQGVKDDDQIVYIDWNDIAGRVKVDRRWSLERWQNLDCVKEANGYSDIKLNPFTGDTP